MCSANEKNSIASYKSNLPLTIGFLTETMERSKTVDHQSALLASDYQAVCRKCQSESNR